MSELEVKVKRSIPNTLMSPSVDSLQSALGQGHVLFWCTMHIVAPAPRSAHADSLIQRARRPSSSEEASTVKYRYRTRHPTALTPQSDTVTCIRSAYLLICECICDFNVVCFYTSVTLVSKV